MDSLEVLFILVLLAVLIRGIPYLVRKSIRTFRSRMVLSDHFRSLRKQNPELETFEAWTNRYHIEVVNGKRLGRGTGIFTLTSTQFAIYQIEPRLQPAFSFPLDQLRWFGRPRKYQDGMNEMWLHAQTEMGWLLIRLYMDRYPMQEFASVLKLEVIPEVAAAYRRRRPYVHAGPLPAQPATQDIHGAWTLGEPVSLYLTPLHLVILSGTQVLRVLPLEGIQQIGALRRLDAPLADGLLRFRAEEADFAFALKHHEQFAQSLAEAARRTLEAPIEQKRKGKDQDEDWEEE